jgi:membrane-bound lytic murein transglycosylase B
MGEIKVRKLDDWIVGVHRDMAEQAGQSLEQYLRGVLEQSALESQRRFAREAAGHLDTARQKYGVVRSSVDILRQQREEM